MTTVAELLPAYSFSDLSDESTGLYVEIYRHGSGRFANGGISDSVNRVWVAVADGNVRYETLGKSRTPAVSIETWFGYYRAIGLPVDSHFDELDAESLVGPMFGGTFLWTSDSRFRRLFPHPIPFHDRYETAEQYRSYD